MKLIPYRLDLRILLATFLMSSLYCLADGFQPEKADAQTANHTARHSPGLGGHIRLISIWHGTQHHTPAFRRSH
jgi:hypothetical protein